MRCGCEECAADVPALRIGSGVHGAGGLKAALPCKCCPYSEMQTKHGLLGLPSLHAAPTYRREGLRWQGVGAEPDWSKAMFW